MSGAASEARTFAAMVRSGSATVEQARKDIGTSTPYRKKVLLHFDICTGCISPETRASIGRLRLIYSQEKVRNMLGIPGRVIQQISQQENILFRKTGRGRRLSPELRERILDRVRARARSADLQREFQIDYDTTIKFRHMVNDYENRRHWTKLTAEQVDQAESWLRAGMRWRDVAGRLGCALATLQRHVEYRKRRTA